MAVMLQDSLVWLGCLGWMGEKFDQDFEFYIEWYNDLCRKNVVLSVCALACVCIHVCFLLHKSRANYLNTF
jgi:hypothetical protein